MLSKQDLTMTRFLGWRSAAGKKVHELYLELHVMLLILSESVSFQILS
jgi:hypothetical protein